MLVCNVSLRPPRRAIAAAIAEIVTAADATATGNIVFATLVDDPTSVGDVVDAYLGEIMLEAASASDASDAGLIYFVGVDEGITITDAWDGAVPTVYADAVVEVASAADVPDASTSVGAEVTTTGTITVVPLSAIDPSFVSSSLTIINTER